MSAEPQITVPRVRRRSVTERLRALLLELAENRALIPVHSEVPWASVTFAGTRHRIELVFTGTEAIAAGERFIDALPDHEFTLPRHLVADAQIIAVDHRIAPDPQLTVRAEVLLLEEG